VAKPEIADFVHVSPRQVYVTGKGAGTTTLTLWNKAGQVQEVYDVEVAGSTSELKRLLHDVMPDENVQVSAVGDSVTLSGNVRSSESVTRAVAVAGTFAPGKVVNLLQVSGVHQVMLEIRVAEMNKAVLRRLGFNFNYLFKGGQDFFYTFLNRLTYLDEQGRLILSNNVNGAFRFTNGQASWQGFIDALKEDNLARVLAEPTLICLSGQTANFLAGGEIPIPVPQGLGTVAIEYKPFGVGLKFTPTVLNDKRISLQVSPEVSELDFTNAITLNGATIPALSTRKASTVIELDDGQSFAIAGLLRETSRDVNDKFPFLGDVPVLGNLFRSSQFQKSETELVIIATPHLVKTLDKAAQKLPTSTYTDPNDVEFFFNLPRAGKPLDGGERPLGGSLRGGLDGEFGQVVPEPAQPGPEGAGRAM
jgi:pilus assembly protein CpaC